MDHILETLSGFVLIFCTRKTRNFEINKPLNLRNQKYNLTNFHAKTLKMSVLLTLNIYFTPCSSVSIVNFE